MKETVQPEEVRLVVIDLSTVKELVSYQKEYQKEKEIPQPAQAAKRPAAVENNEQLYLTGLHLEQYRHATFVAADYYEEALRRDAKDVRNNNAMGLWCLRRGQFAMAEPYFKKAIATLTQRNPNPYDGEPYYNLGWSLKLQGKVEEAFDAFYKSIWNGAWQHAGYFNLARLAALQKNYEEALEYVNQSLIRNYHSHSARHAKVFILRKLDKKKEAAVWIDESLAIDPFNFGCLFEKYLLLFGADEIAASNVLQHLKQISRNWAHNFMEYALDYAHAGLFEEAEAFLSLCFEGADEPYTLVPYYLGWFAFLNGDTKRAEYYYQLGATLKPDFVFPNRVEEVLVLQSALQINPNDAKAFYYLGNFWYDKRQFKEAIECWEKSIALEDNFPTVHRNLALAYYNKQNNPVKALAALEKAFSLDTTDARVLMELDQLYKRQNKDHNERLQFLELHLDLVMQRDDLYLESVTLYNQLGNYQKAKELINGYQFHPWEGGEGKVVGQYLICHLELARKAIDEGAYKEAINLLTEAENYPSNLGEGKLFGAQENDIHYWKGVAYDFLNQQEKSGHYYQLATQGISEPVQAIFYNDPQPDKIFYQGLAWVKLGDRNKAAAIFQRLIDFGQQHLSDEISIDYFAVSLPDLLVFDADLNLRNKIHCLYLMGLGNLGLGKEHREEAEKLLNQVLALDRNHQGALVHQQMAHYLNLAAQG